MCVEVIRRGMWGWVVLVAQQKRCVCGDEGPGVGEGVVGAERVGGGGGDYTQAGAP